MADWEDIGSVNGGDWEDVAPKKKSGKEISKDIMGQVRESMPDYLGSLRGVAEAGRSIVGGGLAGVAGQIAGTLAGLMEHGVGTEEKQRGVERAAASGMQAFSKPFEPTTEKGKEYTGKAGELINEVAIPLAGHMPQLEGVLASMGIAGKARQAAKQGQREAAQAKRTAAQRAAAEAELPPLSLDEAIAQVEKLPENQREVTGPRPAGRDGWIDVTPTEQAPVSVVDNRRQMRLDLGATQPIEFTKKGEPIIPKQGMETPYPDVIAVSGAGEAVPMSREAALARPPEAALEAQRRAEAEANRPAPLQGQGDLFMTDEVTGPIASPINAAERGALPDVMTENPALARRQMDLGFEIEPPLLNARGEPIGGYGPAEQRPGTMYATERGTITRELPDQPTRIIEDAETVAFAQREAEAKARELQAKEAVERGETGDLFGDHMNKARDFELFRDEDGRPLTRKEFEQTVDNLAKEPGTMYVKPENMDEAYRKYQDNFGGVQAGLFDRPTQAAGMADVLKNDAVGRMVENHPLVKAADRFLSQEQQFLDQLKQQGATAEAIKQAAEDVTKATERLEKTRTNVTNALKGGKAARALPKKGRPGTGAGETTMMYEGLGEMIKRTAKFGRAQPGDEILNTALSKKYGANALKAKRVDITTNEAKNKYLPQHVKEGLSDYTKERRSSDAIIADIQKNNIPDIPDRHLSDKFQAGGHYKSVQTNNPVVRKTFAAVSDAYNRAHSNIRTFIQDSKEGIPALFRKMNKKEAGDIWAETILNDGVQRFSAEQLRQKGYNEKQIKFYERLNQALDFAFERINEARGLAGKAPIEKRAGYVAGQLSGDYQKPIFKTLEDGTKEIIGMVGADTRVQLNRRVNKLLENNPQWTAGAEKVRQRGRRESRQVAFEDALEMMAGNNPDTKLLLDTYSKILKDDAYNYMNAKKHTMQKKGVFGMEGSRLDVNNWTNAKEGTASQLRYLEKVLNWAEMSKAVNDVKPLLTSQAERMPNAVRWSSDYIDRALGIQTNAIGHALDGVLEAVGKELGIGPTAIERGVGAAKGAVSKTLLGFINPMFLAINLMQPFTALPAMNSFLNSRGIRAHMGNYMEGIYSFAKISQDGTPMSLGKLSEFEKEIKREGNARNVFGSEIFDHSVNLRRAGYAFNKVAEIGIPWVEGATRGTVFTHYANVLKKSGMKGKELFDIAENLTNQTMTDYRTIEAPSIYKEMGAVGDMAVTLQRYKHNALSNLALLAREAGRNGKYKPIATALATGVAFSGLTGMLGFNEADAAYQLITKAMGKPDTLTRLMLDKLPDSLNYGAISAMTGLDMSKRFGMAMFPDSPSGVIFPGASRLAEAGTSAYDFLSNPNETNFDRMLRGVLPNSVRGIIDATQFQDESGMAYNPRTLEATVERTPRDVQAKLAGGTGLEESKTKAKLYQESLVDKAMNDRRTSAISRMEEDLFQLRGDPEGVAKYFESERGQELVDKYLEAEGSAKALIGAVKRFQKGMKLTAEDRKLLGASSNPKRAKRYMEMRDE